MDSYKTYSDEQLLALLKESDQTAFEELYHRYWDKIFTIAYLNSKNKEASQELVHDVFLSLWDKRYIIQIQNIGGFLATAIRFAVFKMIKKESRRNKLYRSFTTPDNLHDEEALIEAKFLRELLNKEVAQLPEKCRQVFQSSREQGLSNQEIADHFGLSKKAVEAHITKALKTLKTATFNSHSIIFLLSLLNRIFQG